MLKSIKTSIKDTIVYGLGNVAVKIIGLLLIPVFTNKKYFTIDEFGIMGILDITAIVLTALLASALPQSLTRWYWDKDSRENQNGIFFMSFSMQVIISIAFCIVLIPISGLISVSMFSKPEYSTVIVYLIIASCIQAINNIINTLMRLQSKSVLYSVSNIFKLVSVLTLTLYFILIRNMGLKGIYLAQVIGNSLVVLSLLRYTFRNSRVYFDFSVFRSMSAYGFPLLLANISAALLNVIDRFSLKSLTLLKYVALYTFAFKITSVLKLVIIDSIKLAIGPMMIKRMHSPYNKRFYSKALLYSSFAVMYVIIGISLFSYEITKVITSSKQFWDAVIVIPILSLSYFFVNMKEITVYGLHIAKRTSIVGSIVVFSTILGLALNFLLIPVWSIKGAAVATLFTQFVYWYTCYFFSQRSFFVPYEIKKIILLLVAGAVLSFSGIFINGMDLLPRILLKTVCLASFPFILHLFNFYEPVELKYIGGFICKWSKIKDFRNNLKALRGISDDS